MSDIRIAMKPRQLIWLASAILLFVALLSAWWRFGDRQPLRIGVIASSTGTMAMSESTFADAVKLAVEELNMTNGVLGRQVEVVVADPQSHPDNHASEARRLLVEEGVTVIFSRAISASRKKLIPVIEEHDALLVYVMQYEGIEQSPNTIYLGAAPNQQIVPALRWAIKTKGRRLFLIGSDYVFPRTAHAILADYADLWHAEVVGEAFLPLGTEDVAAAVDAIRRAKPDVILNTLNGDTNRPFFAALRQAGIHPEETPTISFSLGEEELQSMDVSDMAGDYAAWTYCQSLAGRRNLEFIERFKRRFGRHRVTSDPIEASYSGVHLWAQAAEQCGSINPRKVCNAMLGLSAPAPSGMLHVDKSNQHAWKTPRVCRIQADGQLEVVWDAGYPVRPEPFPSTRSPHDWQRFLDALHVSWEGRWSAPE